MATLGMHCILELYNCPRELTDNLEFIRHAMREAVISAGATLLGEIHHKFEPQGITLVALLAESHLSIHTWPENNYVAVDVFTCGDQAIPERACEYLARAFRAQPFSLCKLPRGSGVLITQCAEEKFYHTGFASDDDPLELAAKEDLVCPAHK